jgi:undecaprenyl-diphosphatase
MSPLHALLLGLLQGATEFVPVSSSGHLVLVPWLLGWAEPGLAFDTVAHWGTLLAVLLYFRRDLASLALAWLRGWRTRSWPEPQGRLAWLLVLGTLPAMAAGLLLEQQFEDLFSAPTTVAGLLIVTGLLLIVGERLARRQHEAEQLSWWDALLIGIGQAAAIAPGISRSGATMSTGLLRGLGREAAARFSFLLSTPVILGAGLLQLAKLTTSGQIEGEWPTMAVGFLAAAASGYLCIRLLLRYLRRRSLYPFAFYCCAAGIAALAASQPPPPSADFDLPGTPTELVLAGPDALRPLMQHLARAYEARTSHVTVIIESVEAGKGTSYDLALHYERPDAGDQIAIALDALAIVVQPHNPVRELGILQIQDIFAGRAHTWDAYGGPPEVIAPLDQMDGTPSRTFFTEAVMKSEPTTPNALIVPDDAAAAAEVAGNPWAIGYVAMGYVTPQLRALVVEGVAPTPENVARGTYHLIRPVYLTAPHQPSGEAQQLVEFVLSEEGQAVVAEQYGRVEIIRR